MTKGVFESNFILILHDTSYLCTTVLFWGGTYGSLPGAENWLCLRPEVEGCEQASFFFSSIALEMLGLYDSDEDGGCIEKIIIRRQKSTCSSIFLYLITKMHTIL